MTERERQKERKNTNISKFEIYNNEQRVKVSKNERIVVTAYYL